MSDNLALWNAVEKTDPTHTKEITGKSYKGTSPKPHYLVRKATEAFGPCGIGWGFTVEERIENGALLEPDFYERMHVAKVTVWYKWNGERGEVQHIGGTVFSGRRKGYNDKPGVTFTDEDAPKKSVTDALVKALSMIGFAGDIFMGRFDDSKYVNDLRREMQDEEAAAPTNGRAKRTRAEISARAKQKATVHDEILEDLREIETGLALEKYVREALTPEMMQALGENGRFLIEEYIEKRRAELNAPVDDEPEPSDEARMDYVRDCLAVIERAASRQQLETWWNGQKNRRREIGITPEQLKGLMAAVAEKRDSLPAGRSDKPYGTGVYEKGTGRELTSTEAG